MAQDQKVVQDQLLAKLKAQQEDFDGKFTRIGFHGVRLPNGPAEDADGAFGTYVYAIAQERGLSVAEVKNHVQPAETFDPQEIQTRLREEALRARQTEGSPTGRQSVAGKKMAAYIRQEHLVRQLESENEAYDIDIDPYSTGAMARRA